MKNKSKSALVQRRKVCKDLEKLFCTSADMLTLIRSSALRYILCLNSCFLRLDALPWQPLRFPLQILQQVLCTPSFKKKCNHTWNCLVLAHHTVTWTSCRGDSLRLCYSRVSEIWHRLVKHIQQYEFSWYPWTLTKLLCAFSITLSLWCPAVEEMNHNTLPRSSIAEQMCYLQADCSRFAQSKQFIVNLWV